MKYQIEYKYYVKEYGKKVLQVQTFKNYEKAYREFCTLLSKLNEQLDYIIFSNNKNQIVYYYGVCLEEEYKENKKNEIK